MRPILLRPILLFIVLANLPLSITVRCQEVAPAEPSSKSQTDEQAEIRDILGKLRANPKSPYLHNQLAVLYAATGNLSEFEKEINAAIELEPKDPINYFQASLVYGRNRQEKKQIMMLDKALALDPRNPVFRFERARILEVKGISNRARQDYLEAKKLLAAAIQEGHKLDSDHVLRDSRVVEGTYYDSFNNAYSVENLAAGIEKGLARIGD
jgi:tetratricopeptide (TPR) repeat protein